jgi:ribosomal protein L29
MKDVNKMDAKERQSKIQELRLSLIRSQVTAHKATAKTKEIKRALARLLTCQGASERTRVLSTIKDSKQNKKESLIFNNSHKEELEKK